MGFLVADLKSFLGAIEGYNRSLTRSVNELDAIKFGTVFQNSWVGGAKRFATHGDINSL